MTPARLIGIMLAGLGALLLIAVLIGLVWHQPLFGTGLNSRTLSIGGLIGFVGFAILASGLRIMSNDGTN
jgi:hypothetical protein